MSVFFCSQLYDFYGYDFFSSLLYLDCLSVDVAIDNVNWIKVFCNFEED